MTTVYLLVFALALLLAVNLLLDWYILDDREDSADRSLCNLIAFVIGMIGSMFIDWGPLMQIIPLAASIFMLFTIFSYRKKVDS